jgi:lipopolysaccharide biosynthesis glycosyltransferase
MDKSIHILYSTDANGIQLLQVSLYTLLKNKRAITIYDITIAYRSIDSEVIDSLKRIVDKFANNKIRFVDCAQ